MPSPRRSLAAKAAIKDGGGNVGRKNPISKTEQERLAQKQAKRIKKRRLA